MTPQPRTPDPSGRPLRWVVPVSFLLGALLRIGLAAGREFPSAEGVYSLALGRDVAAFGRLPASAFPPGFAGLVALALMAGGTDGAGAPLRAALVVNVVAGLVQGALAYAFARRRLPPGPAVAVALLALLLPLALASSTGDAGDTAYGCLLLGGLLLLERQHALAAGLAWGAAYLFRPEALVAVAAFAVLEGVRRPTAAGGLLLGCALVVVPCGVHLQRTIGGFWLGGGAAVFEPAPVAPQLAHRLADVPAALAAAARSLVGEVGAPIALGAVLCGSIAGGRWLALALPVLALPFTSPHGADLAWAAYLPVVLVAAWLAVPLAQESVAPAHRRWAAALAAVVLLGGAAAAAVPRAAALRAERDPHPGPRAAGLWLRERVQRGDIVVARQPFTSYWAWCRFARVPDGVGAGRIVAWAREAGGDWLEVDVHAAVSQAPELLPLVGGVPEHLQGQLSLEQTFPIAGRPEQTTYVYRLTRADVRVPRQQEDLRR